MGHHTFDLSRPPTHQELQPLYADLLGPSPHRPTVSFGAGADPSAAVRWLRDAGSAYAQAVGNRSHLIRGLRLADAVDLTDGPPP